jgi:hypothetical protein
LGLFSVISNARSDGSPGNVSAVRLFRSKNNFESCSIVTLAEQEGRIRAGARINAEIFLSPIRELAGSGNAADLSGWPETTLARVWSVFSDLRCFLARAKQRGTWYGFAMSFDVSAPNVSNNVREKGQSQAPPSSGHRNEFSKRRIDRCFHAAMFIDRWRGGQTTT